MGIVGPVSNRCRHRYFSYGANSSNQVWAFPELFYSIFRSIVKTVIGCDKIALMNYDKFAGMVLI